MLALLAGPWGLTEFIIAIIVIASALGIMLIVLRRAGVGIPDFVVQIFWIVVCAFVAIAAIRLLMSM